VTFSVGRTRFEFEPGRNVAASAGTLSNALRGAFGAALRSTSIQAYAKWFDPHWREGPSGYRDAPRPFVLRWTGGSVDLIFFQTGEPAEEIEQALQIAIQQITSADAVRLKRMPELQMPLDGTDEYGNLRLIFATPTELKSEGKILTEPHFFCLIESLAERVRTLGRLYQSWPEEFTFQSVLEAAKTVKTIDWNWERKDSWRRSARSGRVHSVGGYTGWADYLGPLGRALPLLEVGRWTGIGRQTVWGKGEIGIESFRVTK
jgi:CRISPR-associated endoribonuclease Cas6